jgi:hypothetical protein
MNLHAEIEKAVKASLPKGKRALIKWRKTSFGGSEVLTVITPAWKTLPVSERVYRLRKALNPKLTEEQQDRIFRVSVLTREEAKKLDQLAA